MAEKKVGDATSGAPTDVFLTDAAAAASAAAALCDAKETPPDDTQATPSGDAKETPSGDAKPALSDTNLYTVDGRVYRGVTYRTLKKRLARLVSSRQLLVLALLLSISAALTAFRGYLLPVTVFLAAERAVFALGLWRLYFTGGKKGGAFLAAMSVLIPLSAIAGLLFFAVFIFSAMFRKLLLLNTASAEALARLIYGAKLWAVLPALLCVAAAYWVCLFARQQRLVLCNLRDGLRYGFAFEGGYGKFSRNCVFAAALMLALQVLRAFFDSFSALKLPGHVSPMFDRLLLSQTNYAVNLSGVIVQAAALVFAAVLAHSCGKIVRKYKAQKKSFDEERKSAQEGTSEVLALEREKAAKSPSPSEPPEGENENPAQNRQK